MRVFATAAAVAFAAMMAWSSSVGAVDVEIHGYPFGCRTPDGETRKPKFGDVGGMYFAGLPQGRKACLETIDRMIYSCGANTTFISHDLNNQYADCLPIFEQQAKWCARHFELQRSKCDAGGSSAPAEPAEAAAEPAVEPADVTMWALKRSNLRGGPGTDHAKVGLLEVGDEVQVMGEIGNWLRIEAPGGGKAFVYAPLLTEGAPERVTQTIEEKPREPSSAVSRTKTVEAPTIPDQATRERVADWLDRCRDMWRELAQHGAYGVDFSNDREVREFLSYYEERDNAIAATIKRYVRTCVRVGKAVNESGRPCRKLTGDVHGSVGFTNDVTRNAENLFDRGSRLDDTQRRTVEDYLQTCIPAYAAVLEGRPLEPYRAGDQTAEVATSAPTADSSRRSSASDAAASSGTERASGDAEANAELRIPIDATHCVKLHETGGKYMELCVDQYGAEADCDGNNRWHFRYEIIDRSFENACNRPIVLRVRHFAKFGSDDHRSYVNDFMSPGNYRPDYYSYGYVLLINNTDHTDRVMSTYNPPPTEIAYCAEFVDTDITPEYLYSDRYRLNEGGEFGSYSGVVDHLRHQGINVGPEMKAYHDAYISSLAHSPCYANVIRAPPVDYEHFPPLDWYEISRMSTFVTYHKRNGGFEALSFDEEADFGGVSFHDVGGTDTHYISDLPKPVGRN